MTKRGWKSNWGGGSGWGQSGRIKTNFRGWLDRSDHNPFGGNIAHLGERLGSGDWGTRRARFRTAMNAPRPGGRGIRSAFGTLDDSGGDRGSLFAALGGAIGGGGKDPVGPGPEQGPGPVGLGATDTVIEEQYIGSVRDRCVEQVTALAMRQANGEDVRAAIEALIGSKYGNLVVEWAGDHAGTTDLPACRAFIETVVEAAMYDASNEPLSWKILRLVRSIFNPSNGSQTQTTQTHATV